MSLFLSKLLVYGSMGILLENLFTGIYSVVLQRDARAPTRSYLWMWPIYGLAGTLFSAIHSHITGIAFVLVAWVHIYVFEFSAGWLVEKLTGKIPWNYGSARYGVMGLIRLDYAPYWLIVAFGYDWIVGWFDKALQLLQRMS